MIDSTAVAGARALPERLNSLDTLLWRGESDPRLRSPVIMVMSLDGVPDYAAFREAHRQACGYLPRLRERPNASALLPTIPVWESDPRFDLDRHVHRLSLGRGAGQSELLELVENLNSLPFDLEHPLWQSYLLEGTDSTACATPAVWVLRVHHCMADGMALLYWLARLLRADWPPLQRTGRDEPWPLYPAAPRTGAGRLVESMRTRLESLPLPTHPRSELISGRGTDRRLGMLSVPAGRFRAAARCEGASVNAAFVTAVVGGFARYHDAHGIDRDQISVVQPVARSGERAWAGNHISAVRITADMDVSDPADSLREISGRLRRARAGSFPESWTAAALTALNQLPGFLLNEASVWLSGGQDLQATILEQPVNGRIADVLIRDVIIFGPTHGSAAMLVMVKGPETGHVTVTADTAAITDFELLMTCLQESFADVLSLTSATESESS